MTMKKAVIKRRKRVIPVAQGGGQDDAASAIDSVEQGSQYSESDERGSLNADGSVNLGLRRRAERTMALLPEPVLQSRGPTPLQSTDLTAYHQTHTPHSIETWDSLSNDNRLAPLTSIAAMSERQSSLSPASFLSPSRKRSFSATDSEVPGEVGNDGPKRLSSIKSILNPTNSAHSPMSNTMEDAAESLRLLRSPMSTIYSPSMPANSSTSSATITPTSSENERVKAERRAALQLEAERMREMLAAKEKELAALG
jgi:GATA-binding protein, other eukaryote